MIETEAQQLVVDAVKGGGGRAIKFNNRFLIGVVDLLLKLPGHQPMLLEAKIITLSPRTRDHVWNVGCTKLQQDFLRDWHEAGMLTGVVSFIQRTGGNVSSLEMGLYHYETMVAMDWQAGVTKHRPLGGKDERFTNIRQQLIGFADG